MNVVFETSSGKKLEGQLTGNSSGRLIVICHGYKSSGHNPGILAIAESLHQKGYDTFSFDFLSDNPVDVQQQVGDITDVLRHFAHYREFILLGISFGALSASIAATRLEKVNGLVTVNGFFGTNKLGKEHRTAFRKFRLMSFISPRYRKMWLYVKHELQPERLRVPVLVIHTKVDAVVSPAQSRQFFARVTAPKEFMELQTASHGLATNKDIVEVVSIIANWLSGKP